MKNFKFVLLIIIILLNHNCIASYPETDTSGCAFPFNYKGTSYSSCTSLDQNAPWCSYTPEFIGIWKYCNDMRKSDLNCVGECERIEDELYPSCATDQSPRRKYCVEQILDMNKESSNKISDDCPSEYKEIPFHTACLKPSVYVAHAGVTEEDKEIILRVHNEWRKNLAVSAAGMNKLYWNDDLAYLAQKHAEQCIFAHDDPDHRSIPKTGKQSGQNIIYISGKHNKNWEYALNTMYGGEYERFEYGVGTKKEYEDYGRDALHYTQIILEKLSKVGCGYAECLYAEKIERFYVCNLDQMQMDYQIAKPYESGPSCQACPDHCVEEKLCDCGGIECYNSGVLDVSSCTCKCVGMWAGKICDTPIIPTHNEHGCAIPFIYKDQLQYDCTVDKEQYPDPFCFSVPEFDNDADHFIPCDWMQSKRRYVAKANNEKKSLSKKGYLLDKFHQNLKRKIASVSFKAHSLNKKWQSSINSPFKHIIKKNYVKFSVI